MSHDDLEETTERRLISLSEMSDFRISKGEPDIRGWDVVTSDNKRIGEVHELIIDTSAMKVRYLDIEVDPKILGIKKSSHVLVPIAGANLDDDDNRVYITRLASTDIVSIPAYDHRPIIRDYESHLLGLFGSESDAPQTGQSESPAVAVPQTAGDFYDDERFSDRGFWGNRRRGREELGYIAPAADVDANDETVKRR
ncbi:MAG: PRC-barrel domain-containing protein [Acidobacteriota bacterium]